MFSRNQDNKINKAADGMLNEGGISAGDAKESHYRFKDEDSDSALSAKTDWKNTAQQIGRRAREWISSSGRTLADASESLKVRVHNNPIQSSFIALGLGLLIGRLARR